MNTIQNHAIEATHGFAQIEHPQILTQLDEATMVRIPTSLFLTPILADVSESQNIKQESWGYTPYTLSIAGKEPITGREITQVGSYYLVKNLLASDVLNQNGEIVLHTFGNLDGTEIEVYPECHIITLGAINFSDKGTFKIFNADTGITTYIGESRKIRFLGVTGTGSEIRYTVEITEGFWPWQEKIQKTFDVNGRLQN